MKQKSVIRQTMALPHDAVEFLDRQAEHNFTSRNAEVVRSIRERMQAATGDEIGVKAPAAASRTDALAGVNSTHG